MREDFLGLDVCKITIPLLKHGTHFRGNLSFVLTRNIRVYGNVFVKSILAALKVLSIKKLVFILNSK